MKKTSMWKPFVCQELEILMKESNPTHDRTQLLVFGLKRHNAMLQQAIYEIEAGRPREKNPSAPKGNTRIAPGVWTW
jgi:hypothetical protein